jgi:endonuclease YncB( thermonuclease family)
MTKEIAKKTYLNLLKNIQNFLSASQEEIAKTKINLFWQIGREINEFLQKNPKETVSGITQILEADLKIHKNNIYKMHQFFQTYPKIPSINQALTWSHYRSLIRVKDEEERVKLEKLVEEKSLGSRALQQKINQINQAKKQTKKIKNQASKTKEKLNFKRGLLYFYQAAKRKGSDSLFIDLGFKVFKKIDKNFKEGDLLISKKIGEEFFFEKSEVKKSSTYTYKAFVNRIIDGDSINVNLDLGFGIFQEKTLRLAQINAAEISSKEGEIAKEKLIEILRDAPFLIVKTNQIDTFGRYISDIFFKTQELDEHETAKNGIYLSQALLDAGVVEFVQY